jgi:hypothetical protein
VDSHDGCTVGSAKPSLAANDQREFRSWRSGCCLRRVSFPLRDRYAFSAHSVAWAAKNASEIEVSGLDAKAKIPDANALAMPR